MRKSVWKFAVIEDEESNHKVIYGRFGIGRAYNGKKQGKGKDGWVDRKTARCMDRRIDY